MCLHTRYLLFHFGVWWACGCISLGLARVFLVIQIECLSTGLSICVPAPGKPISLSHGCWAVLHAGCRCAVEAEHTCPFMFNLRHLPFLHFTEEKRLGVQTLLSNWHHWKPWCLQRVCQEKSVTPEAEALSLGQGAKGP